MKIDGIKLPSDWRELIEELVDGSSLMLDDRSLQDALKEAGYASTSVFRRGAITGTEKLKEWWQEHQNDQPPTYPSRFMDYWAEEKRQNPKPTLRDEVIAQSAWNAARVAGQDND